MINFKDRISCSTTLICAATLAIVFILFLSVNTFYWADDYSFILNVNKNGLIRNCILGYYNWDGRFLTLGALIQGFIIQNFPIEFVTFFWSMLFLSSGFLMYKIISYEVKLKKIDVKNQFLIGTILSIILWLGSYSHISETIYWATGGVYTFNLFLGIVWIIVFNKIQVHEISLFQKLFYLIFTFFVGASTQNLAIALLTLIVLTFAIDFLSQSNKKTYFNILLFAIMTAGLIFIIVAPGNFVRITKTSHGHFDFSLMWFVKNYYMVLVRYIKLIFPLMTLSMIGVIGSLFILFPNKSLRLINNKVVTNYRVRFINLLTNYKWLIIALSTITPFVVSKNLASPRTAIYFMCFIVIFFFTVIFKLYKLNSEQSIDASKDKMKKKISCILFLLIIASSLSFTIYNFRKGLLLKEAILSREKKLVGAKNKIVEIELIDPSLSSYCYKFTDMSLINSDKYNWIRESQEHYFGVKRIIVKE